MSFIQLPSEGPECICIHQDDLQCYGAMTPVERFLLVAAIARASGRSSSGSFLFPMVGGQRVLHFRRLDSSTVHACFGQVVAATTMKSTPVSAKSPLGHTVFNWLRAIRVLLVILQLFIS
jgi:hypothetical protein